MPLRELTDEEYDFLAEEVRKHSLSLRHLKLYWVAQPFLIDNSFFNEKRYEVPQRDRIILKEPIEKNNGKKVFYDFQEQLVYQKIFQEKGNIKKAEVPIGVLRFWTRDPDEMDEYYQKKNDKTSKLIIQLVNKYFVDDVNFYDVFLEAMDYTKS